MLGFNYKITNAKTPEELNAYFPEHDVNALDSYREHSRRYIDGAAAWGRLEVFKALVHKHHANLKKVPGYKYTNLFYSMSVCEDQEARRALFEWLQEDCRYEQLNCGVTELHLKAVLEKGETFLPQLKAISAEIENSIIDTLLNYYIAANAVDVSVEKRIEQVLKEFPDKYSLVVLSFVLQWCLHSYVTKIEQESFIAQIKKLEIASLDFNISLTDENHPLCHMTLVAVLARDVEESEFILTKLVELYPINLNAKTERGSLAVSLLDQGAADLLTAWLDRYPQTLELNSHCYSEDDKQTLAYSLASSGCWGILSEQVDLQLAEVPIDLNAGENEGEDSSETLGSELVEHQQWDLLNKIAHQNQYQCCEVLLTPLIFKVLVANNQHALISAVMSYLQTWLAMDNAKTTALSAGFFEPSKKKPKISPSLKDSVIAEFQG